jgi:hypothetical protein
MQGQDNNATTVGSRHDQSRGSRPNGPVKTVTKL